jgi:meso-butanediol dehydrogenase/(S,S)-butanediol dehydrogenase/diacetyl reductase
MRLAGKVAIVTGVEQDGGQAVAARFLAEGAKVVGTCRSLQQGQQALGDAGDAAVAIEAIPWKAGDAERIVKTAVDRFGRVDILVNSGNNRRIVGTAFDVTEAEIDEEMAVDIKGTINLAKCVVPVMASGGGGSIINLSSVASVGVKGRLVRSFSKGAVSALTHAMALDHGGDNIRVNSVLQGPHLSAMVRGNPDFRKQLESEAPLGRLFTLEDLAALLVFLGSDESQNITGALIPLDAGRALARH